VNLTLHPARSLSARAFVSTGLCAEGCRIPLAPSFARLCDIFPLNLQLLTVNSPASRLFVALPYISPASPLSSLFTHFDRGGRGFTGLSLLYIGTSCRLTRHESQVTCFQQAAASCPSLCCVFTPRLVCFHQLTGSFCTYRGVGVIMVNQLDALWDRHSCLSSLERCPLNNAIGHDLFNLCSGRANRASTKHE
jgi:hypothetical protein